MKYALCLSGHLRTFRETYRSLYENIIKPLNCDIFIHTWDNLGCSTAKTAGDAAKKNYKIDKYIQEIKLIYQPKVLLIEKENDLIPEFIKRTSDIIVKEEDQKFIVRHIGYHLAMFYSIYKANEIKNQYSENYDLTIRCRPDIFFNSRLNLSNISNDTIYVPEIATYAENGMNDQFAIGNSKVIDMYSNIYLNIENYYRNNVCTLRPEILFKYHLIKNNIKINTFDINYDIYRLGGEKLKQYKMHSENI